MASAKQTKAASVFNKAFDSSQLGGDGVVLASTAHPLQSGATQANTFTTQAELSETSLEDALIGIAGFTDDRDIPVALQGKTLHIPRQLVFVAERLLASPYRPATADNDVNALVSKGMLPGGYHVNHRFTGSKRWFIRTDSPHGMKMFNRAGIATSMEGDFETGNVRYKARERYSFGFSDWRGIWASNPS
jgi:hypothetical protein